MPDITLNARERREYHLGAALLAIADGRERAGLAFEISDELAKALPSSATRHEGSLLIPESLDTVTTRAGLDSATSTKGAELKFTEPVTFIELLRQKATVLRLGATVLDNLRGDVKIPRQTGAATASWATQNPGSDASDSNLTIDQVSLAPKTLQGSTSYSRQLLIQSATSTAVDGLVTRDLAKVHGVAIDAAAINGSGASGQPTGILQTSGIGSVVGGTNGLQPTWANITGLELAVANANADNDPNADPSDGPMAYLTTPTIRNTLRNKDRAGGTTGWMIMDGENINGYQVAASKQVPSTLTKGTSSGVCHAILFGAWQELLVGTWGVLELVPDPFRLKKQAMIEVTSYQLVDIAVRHAASFAAMVDALQ